MIVFSLDAKTAAIRRSKYGTDYTADRGGMPSSYLYGEDDDLAEVILAWGQLTRDGRARAKKSVLSLVARTEKLG